jgi:hypothetical protein
MELDTSWISDFELSDEAYKKFYKEKVESVKLYILYVNRNSELFHIKKNNIIIENTILKKENLIELDKVMTLAEDENKATFNTSSFLQMPEGKTIKEEEIEKFIKESKETKTPLRKIMNNNVPR